MHYHAIQKGSPSREIKLVWVMGYPGGIVPEKRELKHNSARSEKQGCGSKSIVQTVPFFKLI